MQMSICNHYRLETQKGAQNTTIAPVLMGLLAVIFYLLCNAASFAALAAFFNAFFSALFFSHSS